MLLFCHTRKDEAMSEPIKKSEFSSKGHALLFPPEHAVAFYTFLSILLKMKQDLGLEAMLEYMGKYLRTIDSRNPKVAIAVGRALDVIPVEIIFNEINKYDKAN
jgi:hypothetical protein